MMKFKMTAAFFCVAVFFFVQTAWAQYQTGYSSLYDSETVSNLKETVGYVSSAMMEGRAPGSEGEKMTAEYVWEKMKEYGVEMLCGSEGETFGIAEENSADTLVSRNVIGFIQGHDKDLKDRFIVVGARMDNLGVNTMTVDGRKVDQIYYGANGNASGIAVLIELARMLQTNSVLLRRSVLLVGFGSSARTYAGAWYFLNRSFLGTEKIDAMVNLDMLGTADNGFYAYTASNADLNVILKGLEGELQPVRPEIVTEEPYPSDHRAFYAKEIPAVYLTSGKYPEHNSERDTGSIIDYEMLEKVLEYSYNLVMCVSNTSKSMDFRPTETAAKRGPAYDDVVSMNDCDVKPMFLNSQDPGTFLSKWVYQYLRYPQECINEGIQGRVVVDFIIDKEGKVTDVTVVKSVDPLLDEEAVRIVSASPKWKAGRVNGERVRTSMTIPIEFKLERTSEKRSFGVKK